MEVFGNGDCLKWNGSSIAINRVYLKLEITKMKKNRPGMREGGLFDLKVWNFSPQKNWCFAFNGNFEILCIVYSSFFSLSLCLIFQLSHEHFFSFNNRYVWFGSVQFDPGVVWIWIRYPVVCAFLHFNVHLLKNDWYSIDLYS